MDEVFLDDLKPVVDAANRRTRQLLEEIAPLVEIDWTTGRVDIRDRGAIARGIREFSRDPNTDYLAASFIATLADGFAVRPEGPGPDDPAFRPIPWRSLSQVRFVEAMSSQDWEWLGIRDDSSVEEVRE